jgi:hypothetical protein
MGGTHIHFWLDPRAWQNGVLLPDVGRTPSALIAWLRQNDDLVVSAQRSRRIAHGVPARSVDLDLAATAPREDPGCPGPCLTYLVFKGPHYGFGFGTGRGELTRLYFATLRRKGSARTFTVAVDAPSPRVFRAVIPTATRILASVRLPARVSAG